MKKQLQLFTACIFCFIMISNINAQKLYAPGVTNPFGITAVDSFANPELIDFDFDNDYDLLIGTGNGDFIYFENTGNWNTPAFATADTNPFNLSKVNSHATPTFMNIDGDSDYDIFSGGDIGEIYLYKNNDASGWGFAPDFALPDTNAFNLIPPTTQLTVRSINYMHFIAGGADGNVYFLKNTGNYYAPNFALPDTIVNVGSHASPAPWKMDGDNDYDFLVGNSNGNILFFENTGNNNSPSFTFLGENLFGMTKVNGHAAPCVVDIDHDGDEDIFVGDSAGNIVFFEYCATKSTITERVCDGAGSYTSPSGNYIWTESGTYMDTILNSAGCDSVITIKLSVGNTTTSTIDVPLCLNGSYISPSGNYEWTVSGTYKDTIANHTGCDSVITINLYDDPTLDCGLEAYYPFSYNTQDESGNNNHGTPTNITYTEDACNKLINAAGFDASQKSNINVGNTIKPDKFPVSVSCWVNVADTTRDAYIYRSDRWESRVRYSGFAVRVTNGSVIAQYGNNAGSGPGSRRTYTSQTGTLKPGNWQHVVVNIKGKSDIEIYIDTVLTEGTYSGTADKMVHTSNNGFIGIGHDERAYNGSLDDLRVYNRALNKSEIKELFNRDCESICQTYSETTLKFCDGSTEYVSPSGKYTWTADGSYLDTIRNAANCDSIIIINLSFGSPSSSTIDASICQGQTYTSPSGTYDWSTTGTYLDTIPNATGCDSVITTNLTVLNNTSGTDIQTACESFTWIDGNTYTENNNTATYTLTNSVGCDSVVTLNLTILESSTGTDTQTACESFTWIDGNTYTENNNTATYTLTNSVGCDSVVTLDLTIVSINNAVNISNNTLESLQDGANYQWLDCNNAYSEITGATNQTFTPESNGNYAVRVTINDCKRVSDCIEIDGITSIGNTQAFKNLTVYPNPANESFAVEFEKSGIVNLKILNLNGAVVKTINNYPSGTEIQIQELETGVYILSIQKQQAVQNFKIIIE